MCECGGKEEVNREENQASYSWKDKNLDKVQKWRPTMHRELCFCVPCVFNTLHYLEKFYRWEKWDLKASSNLPKVTHQGRGGTEVIRRQIFKSWVNSLQSNRAELWHVTNWFSQGWMYAKRGCLYLFRMLLSEWHPWPEESVCVSDYACVLSSSRWCWRVLLLKHPW